MTELESLRLKVRPLLHFSAPGDALPVYYAFYHDLRRTRLYVHEDASGRADEFVAVCQTGQRLFQPTVVLRTPDTRAAVELLRQPLGSPPLCELVNPEDSVDGYRVVRHDTWDEDGLVNLGWPRFDHEILVNRTYAEARVKVLTGFIEPHFFAGFSGGPKVVLPGVAGARLVLDNHGAAMLDDPGATWGGTLGNPVWEEMLEVALKTDSTFLLNVTLNRERAITGVYRRCWRSFGSRGSW